MCQGCGSCNCQSEVVVKLNDINFQENSILSLKVETILYPESSVSLASSWSPGKQRHWGNHAHECITK